MTQPFVAVRWVRFAGLERTAFIRARELSGLRWWRENGRRCLEVVFTNEWPRQRARFAFDVEGAPKRVHITIALADGTQHHSDADRPTLREEERAVGELWLFPLRMRQLHASLRRG